jgi:protein gp37
MAKNSAIEWTDGTWNPWYGCIKVSPGCRNCYMYREQKQYGGNPDDVRRSKTRFQDPLKWGDSRTIFTCSWSDFFIDKADPWRPEAWEIIRQTPRHTYLVLTKRPERIEDQLPMTWPWAHVYLASASNPRRISGGQTCCETSPWPSDSSPVSPSSRTSGHSTS